MSSFHFRRWREFASDRRGSTAVILALSIVPVAGTIGLSVDLGQAYRARVHLQGAADAAALSGAIQYRMTSNAAAAIAAANAAFAANAAHISGATAVSTVDAATKKVSVTGTVDVTTSFIKLVSPSRSSTTVNAYSDALVQSGGLAKNLEVSVMLDVTISMSQSSGSPGLTKVQAMTNAAKNLVDTVVQTSQTPYKSRVALAPFSAAVNVGSYFQTVTGAAPTGSWTSVVERAGAHNASDDAPSGAPFPSYLAMKSGARSPISFIAYMEKTRTYNTPSGAVVTPLSSDKANLKSILSAYTTDGTTAGHIGTAWAWYMLSPAWTSVWTGAAAPAPFSDTVSKVVVLMSDFDYNVYYQGGVGDMNAQAQAVCDAMKAAGVTVYTIGFQVDHSKPASVSLFNNCATDASKSIEAQNGVELIAAFDAVATTVVASVSSSVRLAR